MNRIRIFTTLLCACLWFLGFEVQSQVPFRKNAGQWPAEVLYGALWQDAEGLSAGVWFEAGGVRYIVQGPDGGYHGYRMTFVAAEDGLATEGCLAVEGQVNVNSEVTLRNADVGAGMSTVETGGTTGTVVGTHLHSHDYRGEAGRDESARRNVARPLGKFPLPSQIHYFQGSNQAISTSDFQEVWYYEAFPGIDARWYYLDGQLKYELHVRPGADPAAVRFRYEGADTLRVMSDGRLVIETAGRRFEEMAPVCFQPASRGDAGCEERFPDVDLGAAFKGGELADGLITALKQKPLSSTTSGSGVPNTGFSQSGVKPRIQVSARYRTGPGQCLSFDFPDGYDPSLPLIIDPVSIQWSTYLGGGLPLDLGGQLGDVKFDAEGNVYGVGSFESAFPIPNPNVLDTAFNGGGFTFMGRVLLGADAVVFKLDPSGSRLIWATYLGGQFADTGHRLAVGPDGKVYVLGHAGSGDFPTTPGAFQEQHRNPIGNGFDLFVACLSADGSKLEYSTFVGSSADDYAGDIAVNARGEVFAAGYTTGTDAPTTAGAFDRTSNAWAGFSNSFVFRLNASGSGLVYGTYLGGRWSDAVLALVVNDQDEVFLTGEGGSPDFPTTPGAAQPAKAYPNWADAFLTKLNASGSQLIYSTFLGGYEKNYGHGVAINAQGEAFVTGRTYNSRFKASPGAVDSTFGGEVDVFLHRVAADGSQVLASTLLGGSGRESGVDIAVNAAGDVYLTGATVSDSLPVSPCAFSDGPPTGGWYYWGGDLFLAKLDPEFRELKYLSYFGGEREDYHARMDLRTGACGDEILLGCTTLSEGWPVTPGAFQESKPAARNQFALLKLVDSVAVALVPPVDSCPEPGQPLQFSYAEDRCGSWGAAGDWEWDFGDGGRATGDTVYHAFPAEGQYTVSLRRPACPDAQASTTVELFGLDLGPDLELCYGEREQLDATLGQAIRYLWDNGETDAVRLADREGTIWLEVENQSGCVIRDSLTVRLLGDDNLEVPNVFSPNQDGVNDRFEITGMGEEPYSLQVYDRWGTLKFEADHYRNDWEGGDLPEGTYYYILEGAGTCGRKMGWVMLAR